MHRICLTLLMILAVGLCACSEQGSSYLDKQVGKYVKVQFKRNALGAGSNLPVPPNTDCVNGADVSQSGKLVSIERTAIVLDGGDKTFWIPKDAILMVVLDGK